MSSFKIKGIIAAMVTPITEDQKIHKEAIHRLLNYLIDGGVHGVFAISGAGEFASLTLQEKKDLLEAVVDEVNGRIPVYAGAGAVTTREAVHLTEIAEKIGADVISVIAPYAISPSQDELYDHYAEIAKSTKLPVILYNLLSQMTVGTYSAFAQKRAYIFSGRSACLIIDFTSGGIFS